ncbi:MAG: acetate kinase [Nitrobacter sp. 62-13]|nr:MAG: acetate kinase [Nitrobacter sp. 62-13]
MAGILVLNAGSSSIKFSLFAASRRPQPGDVICEGACEGIGSQLHATAKDADGHVLVNERPSGDPSHEQALSWLLGWLAHQFSGYPLVAAGHRIVHGGSRYSRPVELDADVIAELKRLVPLAPLHQPHHLEAIAALSKLHPDLMQIGCFDTAFHEKRPLVAKQFALPRRLTEEGILRYGFHGLSYEYIASILPDIAGLAAARGRVIVAHLGAGASLCAMKEGKSVATTMGFTALDGLMMSRRCGALDPGVVLYLLQEKGMNATAVSELLYQSSGLLGVSGISDDMKILLASPEPHAREAIDQFVYRACLELGSLVVALGGLDAVVFTAGIGEHAPEIRRRICEQLSWLGLDIDADANETGGPGISAMGSRISAWVIPTDEELMIARHCWDFLNYRVAGGENT